MTSVGRRFLRLMVVLALLGAGPGVSVADVLLFHSGSAPVAAKLQIDDGSTPLPHGDGCHLALPSAPVLDPSASTQAFCAGPVLVAPPVAGSQSVPASRAARPPPSRAPPLLQA